MGAPYCGGGAIFSSGAGAALPDSPVEAPLDAEPFTRPLSHALENSACSIVFGRGLPSGAPIKGSQFVVADIAAAAEHLRSAGVEFTGPVHFVDGVMTPGPDPHDQDFGTFVFFDDPDGNSWSVQQGRRGG